MFIDWANLKNPVYAHDGWSTKDACMAYTDGVFYLFFSAFYEDRGRERAHVVGVRTTDFRNFSAPFFVWDGAAEGWIGLCSPDIFSHGTQWYLTYNSWGDHPERPNQLFFAASTDLERWTPGRSLARDATQEGGRPVRAIDAAVAFAHGRYVLLWKERQVAQLAVAPAMAAEGWRRLGRPAQRWCENGQFIHIDGTWQVLLTGKPMDPFLAPVTKDGRRDEDWLTWGEWRALHIPQEQFNTRHRANCPTLYDWRRHDGHFYLLYAGNTETVSHAGRGDSKLALARSKDLVNWSVPGKGEAGA
jgi:hypothetical protein